MNWIGGILSICNHECVHSSYSFYTLFYMKYGDLFSGIGCVAQALKFLDIPFSYEFACDIDKNCKANLLHNFPVKQFYDNVINITNLPKVDLFTAGFPCQPFSSVNKSAKKGLNHKSGDMFTETLRCLQLCDPEVFILENVVALTYKNNAEYFSYILESLGQLTQYSIHYKVLNSKDYGIPQSRQRIYFIGSKIQSEPLYPEPCSLHFTLLDVLDLTLPMKPLVSNAKVVESMADFMHPNTYYVDNGQNVGSFTKLSSIDDRSYSYCLTASARPRIYHKDDTGVITYRPYCIDEMRMLQQIHPDFENICSELQFAKQIGNGMDVSMMVRLLYLNLPHSITNCQDAFIHPILFIPPF